MAAPKKRASLCPKLSRPNPAHAMTWWCCRSPVRKVGEGRDTEGVSGIPPRDAYDQRGPDQRRSAHVRQAKPGSSGIKESGLHLAGKAGFPGFFEVAKELKRCADAGTARMHPVRRQTAI